MHGSIYDQPGTTRVPAGETDYLTKAAEQLAKVIDSGRGIYVPEEVAADARHKIADGYAQLGAIQRGQMPAELARVMFEQLNGQKGQAR